MSETPTLGSASRVAWPARARRTAGWGRQPLTPGQLAILCLVTFLSIFAAGLFPAIVRPLFQAEPTRDATSYVPERYFASCQEAHAQGVYSIAAGAPGLDWDADGIACEPLPKGRRGRPRFETWGQAR